MKKLIYQNGMKIADLKALLSEWPDTDEHGEPCEVWMMTGPGVSSPVNAVSPLNSRSNDDGEEWADLLFYSPAHS